MSDFLLTHAQSAWSQPWVRVGLVLACSLFLAWVIRRWLLQVINSITEKSESALDDIVAKHIRHPLYLSVVIVGLAWSSQEVFSDSSILDKIYAVLSTIALFLWARALAVIASESLNEVARRRTPGSLIQERTLPVFDLGAKTLIWALTGYLVFLAWDIDVTAWLASAGVIGIAVGFAAKDSLANLFSGVWILADAPFKVGDFINLEDGLRGHVTHIGIRSTRLLTLDEVEITVPNTMIAAGRIVNESGGPGPQHRLHLKISVAYGSDLDRVRRVLEDCVQGAPYLSDARTPKIIFCAFGASGLEFEVLVWAREPGVRELAIDAVNTRIYNALNAADIEIPYDKLDVYLKSTQAASAVLDSAVGGLESRAKSDQSTANDK